MTIPYNESLLTRRRFLIASAAASVGLSGTAFFKAEAVTLQDLIRLAPPPAKPAGNKIDWPLVEKMLQLTLPSDYKKLISTYGEGVFTHDQGRYLYIFNPFDSFGKTGPSRLERNLQKSAEYHKLLKQWLHDDHKYDIYPKQPGLFKCGTVDGDIADLFWLTGRNPDSWPIVVSRAGGGEPWEQFNMSLTTFLVQVLSNKIKSRNLDFPMPGKKIRFVHNDWTKPANEQY